jgi:hypothetical protein
MSKQILDRREFLRSAATVTAAVVAGTGGATILASNRAWAMELEVLGPHEAEVLLAMMRRLYPHDSIGDIYYAEAVEALDVKAKAQPELVEQIKLGVAALDQATHVPFLQLSNGTQTEVLQGLTEDPFFGLVRGHTVVALYDNQNLWPQFGYPGSSYQDGGYLYRGFQDAGWTDQPDAEASPPPFLG